MKTSSCLIMAGFLSLNALAGPPMPPTPDVLATNATIGAGGSVHNIRLTWDNYTNVQFEIVGCTNLLNGAWYHVAYVPVWTNAVLVTNRAPLEFFRVRTIYYP